MVAPGTAPIDRPLKTILLAGLGSFVLVFQLALSQISPAPPDVVGKPIKRSESPFLWDHQEELGLSFEQVKRLKALAMEHMAFRERSVREVHVMEKRVDELERSGASLEAIGLQLRARAAEVSGQRLGEIATARVMESLLSPEQRVRWNRIRPDRSKRSSL